MFIDFFSFLIFFFPRERETETKTERQTSIGCLLYAPQLGIEPATLWYMEQYSNQLNPLGFLCGLLALANRFTFFPSLLR